MIDREKVIRAIEYCTDNVFLCRGDDCPYWQDGLRSVVCWDSVMKDACTLLKSDKYYLQKLTERLQNLGDLAIRGLPEVKDATD